MSTKTPEEVVGSSSIADDTHIGTSSTLHSGWWLDRIQH